MPIDPESQPETNQSSDEGTILRQLRARAEYGEEIDILDEIRGGLDFTAIADEIDDQFVFVDKLDGQKRKKIRTYLKHSSIFEKDIGPTGFSKAQRGHINRQIAKGKTQISPRWKRGYYSNMVSFPKLEQVEEAAGDRLAEDIFINGLLDEIGNAADTDAFSWSVSQITDVSYLNRLGEASYRATAHRMGSRERTLDYLLAEAGLSFALKHDNPAHAEEAAKIMAERLLQLKSSAQSSGLRILSIDFEGMISALNAYLDSKGYTVRKLEEELDLVEDSHISETVEPDLLFAHRLYNRIHYEDIDMDNPLEVALKMPFSHDMLEYYKDHEEKLLDSSTSRSPGSINDNLQLLVKLIAFIAQDEPENQTAQDIYRLIKEKGRYAFKLRNVCAIAKLNINPQNVPRAVDRLLYPILSGSKKKGKDIELYRTLSYWCALSTSSLKNDRTLDKADIETRYVGESEEMIKALKQAREERLTDREIHRIFLTRRRLRDMHSPA